MKFHKLDLLIGVLLLVLAACGGGDADGDGGEEPGTTAASEDDGGASDPDETSPPDTPETTAASGGGGGDAPEVTEMGSFTVNGTEFAVNLLNRCIPFSGPDSDDIDLQPIAQGQGGQLNLYGNADSVEVSVQGSTVEEIGGSIAFAADSFEEGAIQENTVAGDRWTGSATLSDSLGSGSTVDVTWDVMIPDEINDCSL